MNNTDKLVLWLERLEAFPVELSVVIDDVFPYGVIPAASNCLIWNP